MVAKKPTSGKAGKKLKLKKETLKDLDLKRASRIKGGRGITSIRLCSTNCGHS